MKLRRRKAHRFTIGVTENENGTVRPKRKLVACADAVPSGPLFFPWHLDDLKKGIPGFCGSCAIVQLQKRIAKTGAWPHATVPGRPPQVQKGHMYVPIVEKNEELRGVIHWLHDGAAFISKYDRANGKEKLIADYRAGKLEGKGVTFWGPPKPEQRLRVRAPGGRIDGTVGRKQRHRAERGDIARLKKAGYIVEV